MTSRPSGSPRSLRGFGWLAVVATALIACGPPPEPVAKPKRRASKSEKLSAKEAEAKAKSYLAKVRVGLSKGKPRAKLVPYLDDAEPFANERQRESIRRLRQDLDRHEAKRLAKPIVTKAKSQCKEAYQDAAKLVQKNEKTLISRLLQSSLSDALVGCMAEWALEDLGGARELVEGDVAKTALGPKHHQLAVAAVEQSSLMGLIEVVKEPLIARQWPEVAVVLDRERRKGTIGATEWDRVILTVRKGVIKDGLIMAEEILSSPLPTSLNAKTFDELLASGRWGTGKRETIKDAPMPTALSDAKQAVGLAALCARSLCTKPAYGSMYAFGDLKLQAILLPKQATKETVSHATKVTVLRMTPTLALIAEPKNKHPRMWNRALGWVTRRDLKSEDTSRLLPPGAAIVGTRVWGPFRKGQKVDELAIVRAAVGNAVTVERIADGEMARAARKDVRIALIEKGATVLLLCHHMFKLQPGKVQSVTKTSSGERVAVACDEPSPNGETLVRDVAIGELRAPKKSAPTWKR